jgi:tetratricopeptide (TPR) repeat protein
MHRLLPVIGAATMLLAAPVFAQHSHMEHGSAPTAAAPTFDKLGGVHHAVKTTSKDAQRWFDQGLFLCYGFNHPEAIRAFEQAAKADPKCAMAYWGIALANGPNINWPMDSTQEANAYQAVQKAKQLAKATTLTERDYIAALEKRYSKTPGAYRASHDSAYARAMGALSKKYPEDLDAATLYAESLMDLNPWNFWSLQGEPRPGTMDIVNLLESVLKRNPDHVGAIHYYIHSVEAGPLKERSVPYAERLSKMDLDAGHLVHMPSHIFQRVGRYQESEQDNIEASDLDSAYVEKWNPPGIYPMMYYPHNIHFVWAASQMAGRSAQALHYAQRLVKMVPSDMVVQMPPVEFVCPTVYYTFVRFERWTTCSRSRRRIRGSRSRPACGTSAAAMHSPAKDSSIRRRSSATACSRSRIGHPWKPSSRSTRRRAC